ncbi:MAG: AhpC/TSA family protein [Muribaculaceae bacterium]|nr:AhpC/TSA family protein [Muribaculaceae bacterium]
MKLRKIGSYAATALIAATVMSGCTEKRWTAEGTLAGGEGKSLVLEAPNGHGGWYPLDTVEVDSKGKFTVKGEPAGHPEVYRLTLGGESLYFPVDSLEKITIASDASAFGSSYSISGSESADKMQHINEVIAKVVAEKGEQAVAYDPDLKRELAEQILRDPSGIVAYYTIFRRVGNTLMFDPSQKSDLRLIGAVANAFSHQRPSDPRTAFLKDLYISNRSWSGGAQGTPTDTIVAEEILLPEITLLDESGKPQSLSETASKGKVVVLNFTAYAAEASPAFNLELAKIYNANKDQGFEIYQVSVDDDEFFWKQAAVNLPWITVYNSPKDGAENLLRYNVSILPATFIISRQGELAERVDDVTRLGAAVKRYM